MRIFRDWEYIANNGCLLPNGLELDNFMLIALTIVKLIKDNTDLYIYLKRAEERKIVNYISNMKNPNQITFSLYTKVLRAMNIEFNEISKIRFNQSEIELLKFLVSRKDNIWTPYLITRLIE